MDTNAALIFNVANEVAVNAFLSDQIQFHQIIPIIENALNSITLKEVANLEELMNNIEHIKFVLTSSLTKT